MTHPLEIILCVFPSFNPIFQYFVVLAHPLKMSASLCFSYRHNLIFEYLVLLTHPLKYQVLSVVRASLPLSSYYPVGIELLVLVPIFFLVGTLGTSTKRVLAPFLYIPFPRFK